MEIYKPKTVVLGDVESLEALKKQAKKQLADWQLEGFTLTITVPDHKTTSRIEGLFSELNRSLIIHNGLTRSHKIMFIKDFLNKKSW